MYVLVQGLTFLFKVVREGLSHMVFEQKHKVRVRWSSPAVPSAWNLLLLDNVKVLTGTRVRNIRAGMGGLEQERGIVVRDFKCS